MKTNFVKEELRAVKRSTKRAISKASKRAVTRDPAEVLRDRLEVETLRDRFAMAALTGMLAAEDHEYGEAGEPRNVYSASMAAERSYRFADAMMEQRKAKS